MIYIPYFKFQNKKIFYRIRKAENRDAIIFIHGSGENSKIWDNQLRLEIDYNLIALDLPSHAQSEEFKDLSLKMYSECVESLIRELELETVILCGHSLGGAIAQDVYLRNPERINGLILLGTGARLRVSPMILSSLKTNFEEYLESIPIGAFYRKTDEKIIKDYLAEVAQIPAKVTYSDFSICNTFDLLDQVKNGEITIPTLVICGVADKLTPLKYSKFFEEKIEKSELVAIKRAGHMVMIEKPEETSRAIIDFIINKFEEK